MGSHGLGGGGESGGGDAVDLGMHGLGATAGLFLLRVAGDGWETASSGGGRATGLGAMGGGQGLPVAGSFGLGANGGFFTPARRQKKSEICTSTQASLKTCFCSGSRNSHLPVTAAGWGGKSGVSGSVKGVALG